MAFQSPQFDAVDVPASERSAQQWKALGSDVFVALRHEQTKLSIELDVLRELASSRAEALGESGARVLRSEIAHREASEVRLMLASERAYDVSTLSNECTAIHFESVQQCAEWFNLARPSEVEEAEAAPLAFISEAPQEEKAPRAKCAHADVIRRFAQVAVVRGLKMDDKEGRRAAFSKLLGREVATCADLTAEEWAQGHQAVVDGVMWW